MQHFFNAAAAAAWNCELTKVWILTKILKYIHSSVVKDSIWQSKDRGLSPTKGAVLTQYPVSGPMSRVWCTLTPTYYNQQSIVACITFILSWILPFLIKELKFLAPPVVIGPNFMQFDIETKNEKITPFHHILFHNVISSTICRNIWGIYRHVMSNFFFHLLISLLIKYCEYNKENNKSTI